MQGAWSKWMERNDINTVLMHEILKRNIFLLTEVKTFI